ncbi:recombinase family protein [Streptomyces sp. NPDC102437]|uniref:recombinase family protein n=1 Tax=Streptomyces sp. NPDC102437 TaxID=3366175 RepID=UPI00380AF128
MSATRVGNQRRRTVLRCSFRILIGYCRTSTADQNPDHQIDALLCHGVDRDNIHVDVASGAKASRPKLDLVMQLLREGDTLKVTRLDRLSRSVVHLVALGAELRERGIGLHAIEQGIDTTTMEGRAMFGRLFVLAELQRQLIVANTNDGLASARGRVDGRRPKLTADQAALAQRLCDEQEETVQQIADMFGAPAPRRTGTSTKPRPSPANPRRPWSWNPDRLFAAGEPTTAR